MSIHQVTADFKAFDEQHERESGEPPLFDGNRLWFANGARREVTPYGVMIPPSPHLPDHDPYRREDQLSVRHYWRIRYKRESRDFESFKEGILNRGTMSSEEHNESMIELKKLQRNVRKARRKLREAERVFETPERTVTEEEMAFRAKHSDFLEEVRNIKV